MHLMNMIEGAADEAGCTPIQAHQIGQAMCESGAAMMLTGVAWWIPGLGYIGRMVRKRRWYKEASTGIYKQSVPHYGIGFYRSLPARKRERAAGAP